MISTGPLALINSLQALLCKACRLAALLHEVASRESAGGSHAEGCIHQQHQGGHAIAGIWQSRCTGTAASLPHTSSRQNSRQRASHACWSWS